jgi:hypothetical protein
MKSKTASPTQRVLQVITWIGGGLAVVLVAVTLIAPLFADEVSLPGRVGASLVDSSVPIAGEWVMATLSLEPTSGQRLVLVSVLVAALALAVAATIAAVSAVTLLSRGEIFSHAGVRRFRMLSRLSVGAWFVSLGYAWVTTEIAASDGVRTGLELSATWFIVAIALSVLSQAVDQGRRHREDVEGLV